MQISIALVWFVVASASTFKLPEPPSDQGDTTLLSHVTPITQGLVFAKEKHRFTLSGDKWRLVTDFPLTDYRGVIDALNVNIGLLGKKVEKLEFEFPSESKMHIRQDVTKPPLLNSQLRKVMCEELNRIARSSTEVQFM